MPGFEPESCANCVTTIDHVLVCVTSIIASLFFSLD